MLLCLYFGFPSFAVDHVDYRVYLWLTPSLCLPRSEIFETIYFAAVSMSCELAQEQGPYETYEGSPMSKGKLQPDMWG